MRDRILQFFGELAVRWTLLVCLLFLAASLAGGWVARDLRLLTGQMDLTPKDNPVRKGFARFLEDFQVLDDLFLLVRYRDEARGKTFARELARELEASPEVREVVYRLDLATMKKQFLYLSETEKVREILEGLEGVHPLLLGLIRRPCLNSFFDIIAERVRREDGPVDWRATKRQLELLRALLKRMDRRLAGDAVDRSDLWQSVLEGKEDEKEVSFYDDDGWFVAPRGRKLLLTVRSARSTSSQQEVITYFTAVKTIVDRVGARYPDVQVGFAGSPAVTYDEERTVTRDLKRTSLMALVGISILFMVSMRSVLHPLLGVATLVGALLCIFGLTQLVIGHLTLVSSAFTASLVGLGIAFGIHVVAAYEEQCRSGVSGDEAIRRALRAVGPGVITGATTSAAAFYTMLLTEFTAFRELGFIAGTGLVLCMLAMLVILPALIALKNRLGARLLGERFVPGGAASAGDWAIFSQTARVVSANGPSVLLAFALCTVTSLPVVILSFGFDYNLLNLQASKASAVLNERELVEDFNISPEFNVLFAHGIAEVHRIHEALEKNRSVARVESIATLIPVDLKARQGLASRFRPLVQQLSDEMEEIPDEVTCSDLASNLRFFAHRINLLKILALAEGRNDVVEEASGVVHHARSVLERFEELGHDVVTKRLRPLQRKIFGDLLADVRWLAEAFDAAPYTLETIPSSLRDRLVGQSGAYAIYAFPSIDVRQEAKAKRFIRECRAIAPELTGLPIIKDEMIELIRRGFYKASLYAVIALFLMVFLDFLSLKDSLLALGPLALGALGMLAYMYQVGLKFNPANFIALPLILGIGVDNGVHLLHRFKSGADLPATMVHTDGPSS